MFDSVGARFALRSCLVGVASAASVLLTSLPIDSLDAQKAALTFIVAALSYAGIGAAVPAVEPSIGKKAGETVDG